MTTYRIRNWNKHFENNRTRELKKLDWVMSPNKHDGDGFTELLDHEEGMAHYGAWHLILQVASKCDPRGTLLRDGAEGGKIPHTARSIARITRGNSDIIEAAIVRLLNIGWLESYEETAEIPHDPASSCGKVPIEGKGREGKGIEGNRIEGKEEEATPSAPVLSSTLQSQIKSIKTARPEFKRIQEQSLASVLSGCPFEIREKVVHEFVENTANMLEAPKDPMSLLKGYIRYACRDIKPTGTAPKKPRQQHFDEIVTDIARDLWEHRDDQPGFTRAMKAWKDKTRDIPPQNGMSCLDEALDIVKRKRQVGK